VDTFARRLGQFPAAEETTVSQSVQVVCHPASDSAFSSDVELHMAIELPPDCRPGDLVREIETGLRAKYPRASIEIASLDPDGTERWEVYRDGPRA
jgi:hypothetical protein